MSPISVMKIPYNVSNKSHSAQHQYCTMFCSVPPPGLNPPSTVQRGSCKVPAELAQVTARCF
eukprot:6640916-Pyramimonas_sp.AAC.1